jgi:hypothetical protein
MLAVFAHEETNFFAKASAIFPFYALCRKDPRLIYIKVWDLMDNYISEKKINLFKMGCTAEQIFFVPKMAYI